MPGGPKLTLLDIARNFLKLLDIAQHGSTLPVTSTLPAQPDVETTEAAFVFCTNNILLFFFNCQTTEREGVA